MSVESSPYIRRIVVPTDYSPVSLAALDVAMKLAYQCQAAVDLLHVVEPVEHWDVPGADFAPLPSDVRHSVEHYRNKVEHEALLELQGIVNRPGVSGVKTVVEFGHPVHGILEYAKRVLADIICMGTHGSHTMTQLVMGSTTLGVTRQSPIPVLVVGETCRTSDVYTPPQDTAGS